MDILKNYIADLTELTTEDKEILKKKLEDLIYQDKNTFTEKQKEYKRTICPKCNSDKYVKNGLNSKDIQSYCCKNCGKYFCDTTGQAIHRLHLKDKWFQFIEIMFSGSFSSIRDVADDLGVDKNTIFNWRHKVLNAIKLQVESFNGIVELDDLHYNFSEKGQKNLQNPRERGKSKKKAGDNDLSVKVLAVMDRVGTLKLDVVRVGRLKANDIKSTGIQNILNEQTNIITSDKHPSIKSFVKSTKIKHETFLAKHHSRAKLWHVNTINERANRLDTMINETLKGVSTKYLQNYANWFKLIELKKYIDIDFFDQSFKDITAWFNFHNTDKNYQKFLYHFSNF